MNTKAKGARFERKVKKYLQDQGLIVVRSAASAFPDLLAIPKVGLPIFIECKCNGRLSKDEKEQFKEFEDRGQCVLAYPKREGKYVNIKFKEVK